MSVTSALSTMSISCRGEVIDLEKALGDTTRALQKHLNDLECVFRTIAMSSDQQMGGDDMEDLKQSCAQVDQMQDHILKMNNLFDDLMDMSDQLVYEPINKEEKAYLKQRKIDRKVVMDEMKKKFAEARKEYKRKQKEEKQKMKEETKE